jgi:hypothetical protein
MRSICTQCPPPEATASSFGRCLRFLGARTRSACSLLLQSMDCPYNAANSGMTPWRSMRCRYLWGRAPFSAREEHHPIKCILNQNKSKWKTFYLNLLNCGRLAGTQQINWLGLLLRRLAAGSGIRETVLRRRAVDWSFKNMPAGLHSRSEIVQISECAFASDLASRKCHARSFISLPRGAPSPNA